MNAEQFTVEMHVMSELYGDDAERNHIAMDNLMCQMLEELGYGQGVTVYRKAAKWYA